MTIIKLRCFATAHYKPLVRKKKYYNFLRNNIQFSVQCLVEYYTAIQNIHIVIAITIHYPHLGTGS
jgi:hypothetical protein